jgi:predicted amidohydrolase YtcJ
MRVGDANEPRVYAWRKLFDLQARLVEGSDYFARPAEPLAGFLAAMTRRNAVGLGHDDSATRAAVYRMHVSATDGDSVTWTDDLLVAPLERLAAARARRTVSAGRVTWDEAPHR